MGTELERKFRKASWLIANGPPQKSSNEVKLRYYSLFKQATLGDVQGEKPYRVQFEARAKWDSWAALKGMPKEEAMQSYVDLLAADDPNWEQHPALKDYREEA